MQNMGRLFDNLPNTRDSGARGEDIVARDYPVIRLLDLQVMVDFDANDLNSERRLRRIGFY
jgi:hypothetical protein